MQTCAINSNKLEKIMSDKKKEGRILEAVERQQNVIKSKHNDSESKDKNNISNDEYSQHPSLSVFNNKDSNIDIGPKVSDTDSDNHNP